jgi:hypothetical protein
MGLIEPAGGGRIYGHDFMPCVWFDRPIFLL